MKKTVLILSILLSSSLLSDELSWVDQQVNAIKPPRTGMKTRDLNKIYNPFIFLKKEKTSGSKTVNSKKAVKKISTISKTKQTRTTKKVLVLGAILNNSVMINGEWYRLGESINGYKITLINRNSVLLSKQKKQLLLSTKSSSTKLKFLNK